MPKYSTGQAINVAAIGDIHGRRDLLVQMLAALSDKFTNLTGKTVIVCVGDYIDRGPESADVIELLAQKPVAGVEWLFLRGNHEQWLLDALDGNLAAARAFLEFGGRSTAASYGIKVPLSNDEEAIMNVMRSLRSAIPSHHMTFLHQTKLHTTIGDYVFCHAGVRPGVPLASQSPRDLMSIRDEFLNAPEPLPGHCVVHGHTPSETIVNFEHRIGVDTGAYATNCLGAVLLSQVQRETVYIRNTARN